MVILYCSIKWPLSVADFSEAMYGNQPIFMQLFLTFSRRQSQPLSHFYHISGI